MVVIRLHWVKVLRESSYVNGWLKTVNPTPLDVVWKWRAREPVWLTFLIINQPPPPQLRMSLTHRCKQHHATVKPSNTTLIICNQCQYANEIWPIQRSAPSKPRTVRRGLYHPWCVMENRNNLLSLENFGFLYVLLLCINATNHLETTGN